MDTRGSASSGYGQLLSDNQVRSRKTRGASTWRQKNTSNVQSRDILTDCLGSNLIRGFFRSANQQYSQSRIQTDLRTPGQLMGGPTDAFNHSCDFIRVENAESESDTNCLRKECTIFTEISREPGFEYNASKCLAKEEQNTEDPFHQRLSLVAEPSGELGESHSCVTIIAADGATSSSISSPCLDSFSHNSETINHIMTTDAGIVTQDNIECYLPWEPALHPLPQLQEAVKPTNRKKRIFEGNWESLPDDIQGFVLKKLRYEELFQLKVVSKEMKNFVESPTFLSSRGDVVSNEGILTALHFYIKQGALHWSGFDLILKQWRPLSTLSCLPSPDMDLFQEYLISAGGGLLCANVSKSLENEKLVVCNPMTHIRRILPPLNYPRNPVLMHVMANPGKKSYKIIVAGSSGMNEGRILSRKTEVFDSLTSQWEVTGDLPGFEFSLNEYQAGVCINGMLYCIAFLDDRSGKGVLAYDVERGEWLSHWICPIPCSPGHASIAQLVECDGEVYLFLERESGRTVEHRIDRLVESAHTSGGGTVTWENVVAEPKSGGRGLLVYPEYACVGFGAGKLCIFNTLERTGKVYDLRNGAHSEPLPSPQNHSGGSEAFHSLNPLSFTFGPDFGAVLEIEHTIPVPDEVCTV